MSKSEGVEQTKEYHSHGEKMYYDPCSKKCSIRIRPTQIVAYGENKYSDIIWTSADKRTFYCGLCKEERAAGGNNSNSYKHVAKVHPEELDLADWLKQKAFMEENPEESNNSKRKKTLTLEEALSIKYQEKRAMDAETKRNVLPPLLKVIAHGAFPAAIVCNKAVKTFVQSVVGLFNSVVTVNFPSLSTTNRQLDVFLENENQEYMSTMLKVCGNTKISITIDGTTAKNNTPYSAITAHFFDEEFVLQDKLLSISPFRVTRVGHTGLRIRDWLRSELNIAFGNINGDNDIQKRVSYISADCASSNQVAFDSIANVERIKCFGHRLNTLMENMDANDEYKTVFDAMTYVLTKIKSSSKNQYELLRVQDEILAAQGSKDRRVLPKNSPRTRWGFDYLVLKRALCLMDYITKMDDDNMYYKDDTVKYAFRTNLQIWVYNQSILDLLLELFQRVQFWIIQTQSCSTPTISLVIFALDDMRYLATNIRKQIIHLINTDKTTNVLTMNKLDRIIVYFQEQMNIVFAGFRENPLLQCAKLLDTRVCNLTYNHNELGIMNVEKDRLFIKKINYGPLAYLKQLYIKIQDRVEPVINTNNNLNVEENWMEVEGLADNATPINFESDWSNEVNQYNHRLQQYLTPYIAKIDDQLNLNPMHFWKENQKALPMMTKAALLLLAAPSQSAASERVFSTLTYVVNKSRCALKSLKAAALIRSAHRYKQVETNKSRKGATSFPPYGRITSEYVYTDRYLVDDDDDDEDYDEEDAAKDEQSSAEEDDDEVYDEEDLNELTIQQLVQEPVITSNNSRIIADNNNSSSAALYPSSQDY